MGVGGENGVLNLGKRMRVELYIRERQRASGERAGGLEVAAARPGRLVAQRKQSCLMEFVAALGIWFVPPPRVLEFQSHLQDFPRFWLQLESSGGREEGGWRGGGG